MTWGLSEYHNGYTLNERITRRAAKLLIRGLTPSARGPGWREWTLRTGLVVYVTAA